MLLILSGCATGTSGAHATGDPPPPGDASDPDPTVQVAFAPTTDPTQGLPGETVESAYLVVGADTFTLAYRYEGEPWTTVATGIANESSLACHETSTGWIFSSSGTSCIPQYASYDWTLPAFPDGLDPAVTAAELTVRIDAGGERATTTVLVLRPAPG